MNGFGRYSTLEAVQLQGVGGLRCVLPRKPWVKCSKPRFFFFKMSKLSSRLAIRSNNDKEALLVLLGKLHQ